MRRYACRGTLSTAGHCDQSRLAMICAPASENILFELPYRGSGCSGIFTKRAARLLQLSPNIKQTGNSDSRTASLAAYAG
jgi:hypothetical protein